MTVPFCTLCGNTTLAELGTAIGICLDASACHQRQLVLARKAGAREERERIIELAGQMDARCAVFDQVNEGAKSRSFADLLRESS